MSYFRNVELDGAWVAGGTYTFEVDTNEIATAEYPSMPSGTWEWLGNYTNWWFSHGLWHEAVPPEPFGYYDPPFDWGWTVEDVLRARECHYEDEELVCVGENGGTRSGDGLYGVGSHWTGSDRVYEYVGGCASTTEYNRKFGIYTDSDSLTGQCADEPAPSGMGKYLFDNNSENLEGAVNGLNVLATELFEDGWTKYTVQVAIGFTAGTYYIKGKTYLALPGGNGGGEPE